MCGHSILLDDAIMMQPPPAPDANGLETRAFMPAMQHIAAHAELAVQQARCCRSQRSPASRGFVITTRLAVSLLAAVLAVMAALLTGSVRAESWPDRFIDPEDGSFDISEYLLDHRGALPVPIIITEPAVGYGGGVALGWFSQSLRDAAANVGASGRVTPPNIYALAVFGTENGTKGAAVGARMTFDEDRWRYRGVVAWTSVNLDFYGIGNDLAPGIGKIGYNLKGAASFHEVTRRIGDTDNFVGARWLYLDLTSSFNGREQAANLQPKGLAQRSSGLGLTLVRDSRDNIFTTRSGVEAALDVAFYGPYVGSDDTFQTYRSHVFGYWPVHDKLVIALRADARAARGDVPFYQFPFIDLRGAPSARYQNENIGVLEAEARYYVTPRWIALGFIGAGRAWGRGTSFDDAGTVVTKGVGFRYVLARRLGLSMGIDIARGPEDTAFYLQMGNAWR